MKYALVTGGSRGIGRAVSCKLAEMGYFILINYQSNDAEAEKTLQSVREKGSDGELMKFDVTDSEAIAAALGNWSSQHPDEYIEVLVNNAGIRKDNLMLWMTGEEWSKVLFLPVPISRPALSEVVDTAFIEEHAGETLRAHREYRILVRYPGNAGTGQLLGSQRRCDCRDQSAGTGSSQEESNGQRGSSGIYPHRHDRRN